MPDTVSSNSQNIAYVRVSSLDQNESRQKEQLSVYGINKYFIDKVSGKDTNRPGLKELLDYIREGDTVYVTEFSRLGRSTTDLLTLVEKIQTKGAHFISIKERFDTDTPSGRLQMRMLAAIAEFERDMILERQREGIQIAKTAGRYKGRKCTQVENIGIYYEQYITRKTTKTAIAKELGISRNTLNRLFDEYNDENHRSIEHA